MEVKLFIADCEFIPSDQTMLPLHPGDVVDVLFAEGDDWWFGRQERSGAEGWFPPTYGHLALTSHSLSYRDQWEQEYPKLSMEDLYLQRVQVFQDVVEREQLFVNQLKVFIDQIIVPIEYQDTNFKRIFLGEPSIAVSFSLYTKIYSLCTNFLKSLKQLSPPSITSIHSNLEEISSSFAQFAPSLRIFSQYIVENSNTLNVVKSYGKSLNLFLSDNQLSIETSIESYLILPVEHYSHYLSSLDLLIYLSSCLLNEQQSQEREVLSSMRVNYDSLRVNVESISLTEYNENQIDKQKFAQQAMDEKAVQDLREAGDIIQGYSKEVDEKLVAESRKHILLAVETQFVNNPKIFSPDREYITEGELELVRLDSKGAKVYHAHLFNDALVLSTRITGFTGKFKFVSAVSLINVTLKQVSSLQMTNAFCLETNYEILDEEMVSRVQSYTFHCRSRSGLEWWMANIQQQLSKLAQRIEEKNLLKEKKRGSMIKIAKRASVNWGSNSSDSPSTLAVSDSISPARTSESQDNLRASIRLATNRIQSFSYQNSSPTPTRTHLIFNYLSAEYHFQKKLYDFQQIAIEPLINASKGADLTIGLTDDEKDDMQTQYIQARRGSESSNMLFERRGSYLDMFDTISIKKQSQVISEILLDSNLQIFFSSIESITSTLMEFLLLLEIAFPLTNTGIDNEESIGMIGKACLSTQAETLYELMLTYASSYHSAIKIFAINHFVKFKNEIENKLKRYSTTNTMNSSTGGGNGVISVLVSVLNFPERLKVFLIKLHDITSHSHPDFQSLDQSIQRLTEVTKQMQELFIEKTNYEKLLSIQGLFYTNNFFSSDSAATFLQSLVTNQRKFIREGDLIKICRKENKEYRFWLFNDALIYGKFTLPLHRYKLHRVILLNTICNIQPYSIRNGTSIQYSFIINSLEKSFILIASTEYERNAWINDINQYCTQLQKTKEKPKEKDDLDDDNEPAPVWIPDSATSTCCICNTYLNGVTTRRHHCRKCGKMVCSKHSMKRILLPNLHKTQLQRVCDVCSVVIEERTSLRLSRSRSSESLSTSVPTSPPTPESPRNRVSNATPFISSPDPVPEVDDNDTDPTEENDRANEMSKRFSMKFSKGVNPLALATIVENQTKPEPPPVRKDQFLNQLKSQKLQLHHVERESEEISIRQNSSRGKVIPAFSVPISFMLTHDSVKLRRSSLCPQDRPDMELVEIRHESRQSISSIKSLPRSPVESTVSYKSGGSDQDRIPSLNQSHYSNSHANGLLNMIATVMADERELLQENSGDENSSDDDEDSLLDGLVNEAPLVSEES